MKLLEVLSKLNNNTLIRVNKYFSSSYFDIDESNKNLITLLIRSIQNKTTIDKLELWIKIFPGKKFNDHSYRILLTKTLTHLIGFFSVEELRTSKLANIKNATDYLSKKEIYILNNRLSKTLSASLQNDDLLSGSELFNIFSAMRRLIDVKDSFERKKMFIEGKKFKEDLIRINSVLDSFYFVEKIRISLILNNPNLLTDMNLVRRNDAIINKLKGQNLLDKNALTNALEQIYKLDNSSENKKINQKLILDELGRISKKHPTEAYEIYDTLYNYYVRLGNQGVAVVQELFSILQFGLNTKLLLSQGSIDPTDYRNIVFVSCRNNEYDWALNFVEDYKDYLSPDYKQSAYSFNKARVFMNMKRYEDVIDTLRNVEYEDMTYNINSRLMLLASFYELDEYEILESTIKAFKVFLRRKRNISVARKANFTDHCDVIYNLIKASDRKDPKRIEKAMDILSSNPGIPNKTWLKEKIAEVSAVLGIKPNEQTTEDQTT